VKNNDSYLLDASAILALLGREPGHDKVAALLISARIYVCAATLLEVAAKLLRKGASLPEVEHFLTGAPATIGTVVPFDHSMAIRGLTQAFPNISLGDRICIATAMTLDVPAVTSDFNWKKVAGLKVHEFRPRAHP
jgi:ribonuclease VapC